MLWIFGPLLQQVVIMVLKVDLTCHQCYKKVKKVLCKLLLRTTRSNTFVDSWRFTSSRLCSWRSLVWFWLGTLCQWCFTFFETQRCFTRCTWRSCGNSTWFQAVRPFLERGFFKNSREIMYSRRKDSATFIVWDLAEQVTSDSRRSYRIALRWKHRCCTIKS